LTDKIDPFDVGDLEKSLNESATRVSALWVSYLIFGLYLATAAGNVTARQLFLSEPLRLPVLNLDLPLVGFFLIAPTLLVIFHGYVLLQLVLLARTAAAYNDAVNRAIGNETFRARVRQRLTNTLFAQMLAGSPRERDGLLGWLLKLVAWPALAVAPLGVLLVFEIKFLAYHGDIVTWVHRILVAVDLLILLLLWRGTVDGNHDIHWRNLLNRPWHLFATVVAGTVVFLNSLLLTFPGEFHAGWTRHLGANPDGSHISITWTCEQSLLAPLLPSDFDRIALAGESFTDQTGAKSQEKPGIEARLEHGADLRGRDLICADLQGTDLRRADFSGARLEHARFDNGILIGARFDCRDRTSGSCADLEEASLRAARAQSASFDRANLRATDFDFARLQGSSFYGADLRLAHMDSAQLQGTNFTLAQLEAAWLSHASLQGASLLSAKLEMAALFDAFLQGANFQDAKLQGASLVGDDARAASFDLASVWRSDISNAKTEAALIPDSEQIERPELCSQPHCPDDPKAFDQLRDQTGISLAPGLLRNLVLSRLRHLDPSIKAADDPKLVNAWKTAANQQLSAADHRHALAEELKKAACDTPEPPYVIEGLMRNGRIAATGIEALGLVAAFSDDGNCPGARGLSAAQKDELRSIAQEAAKPPKKGGI
jgi:uncharacterized protein YjbI with pentapeptide repeats